MILVATICTIGVSAVTLINPANSATISGTAILNATNSSLPDMVNCTFYAKSASTANSSWTSLGTFTNSTANPLNINGTFVSTVLEDSTDYTFNATCRNSSNSLSSASGTATVKIDNTIPQAPTSVSPTADAVDTDGSIDFSGTVVGRNTTGCTLYFSGKNPGSSSYAMTHSGDSCTVTVSSMPEESYTYYINASDGTNSTNSSSVTSRVDIQTSAGKRALLEADRNIRTQQQAALSITQQGEGLFGIPIALIVIIVIVIVAIIIIRRK